MYVTLVSQSALKETYRYVLLRLQVDHIRNDDKLPDWKTGGTATTLSDTNKVPGSTIQAQLFWQLKTNLSGKRLVLMFF